MFARGVPAARPKLPANLKGDNGFASTRRHGQEEPPLSGEDGLDKPVDRNSLVAWKAFASGQV